MNIYLASDHAGFQLKEDVKQYLTEKKLSYEDMGAFSTESANWVEYGAKAAAKVSQDPENSQAILICGSGIGMSIVGNKFKNVRAALCNDPYAVEMSRRHNNANILTMGARVIEKDEAFQILDIWFKTSYEGGRHQNRLDYLRDVVEKNNFK